MSGEVSQGALVCLLGKIESLLENKEWDSVTSQLASLSFNMASKPPEIILAWLRMSFPFRDRIAGWHETVKDAHVCFADAGLNADQLLRGLMNRT